MNIGKSNRKIKNDTLGGHISQLQNPNYQMGEPKRQHFFSAVKEDVQEAIILGAAEQAMSTGLIGLGNNNFASAEKDAQIRKEYNDNLKNLDPTYASLEPQHGFILRCFVFTGNEYASEESTLVIGNYGLPKVQITHERGKEFIKEEIVDPYAYRGNAVIVAIPNGENFYKAGDLVQLDPPTTVAPFPGRNFVVPKFSYLHPNSKNPDVPKDLTDPDFGYVIVGRNQIILRYAKAE